MRDRDSQISSLREGCGLHLQPPATAPARVQVPITSTLKLEVTGYSGRGVFAPLHQQPCSPIQSCQSDYISAGWGGGRPKERRCPAGDRPLNTSSVLLPHVCQYTYHLSPRLPQNQSLCLHHSPAILQKFNQLHLSLPLSSLWSANYISPKIFIGSCCLLLGAQLIYQLFMLVAAHYTD